MRRALVAVAAYAVTACARQAEPARPVADQFIEVDYPPPPAEVEERDERLAGRPECVWMDGHWAWVGRRWRWTSGEWVVPPPGCLRAPPTLSWSRDTPARLYYTPPRWYRPSAEDPARAEPCAAPIPCLQRARPQ
ncbi:MAG: YXWGXW repeat-containing protein [Pseudomonadota bacterium]|nr:MAG: hypothetical protein DIU78_02155 [Pseudomonadota bacterium]